MQHGTDLIVHDVNKSTEKIMYGTKTVTLMDCSIICKIHYSFAQLKFYADDFQYSSTHQLCVKVTLC